MDAVPLWSSAKEVRLPSGPRPQLQVWVGWLGFTSGKLPFVHKSCGLAIPAKKGRFFGDLRSTACTAHLSQGRYWRYYPGAQRCLGPQRLPVTAAVISGEVPLGPPLSEAVSLQEKVKALLALEKQLRGELREQAQDAALHLLSASVTLLCFASSMTQVSQLVLAELVQALSSSNPNPFGPSLPGPCVYRRSAATVRRCGWGTVAVADDGSALARRP